MRWANVRPIDSHSERPGRADSRKLGRHPVGLRVGAHLFGQAGMVRAGGELCVCQLLSELFTVGSGGGGEETKNGGEKLVRVKTV